MNLHGQQCYQTLTTSHPKSCLGQEQFPLKKCVLNISKSFTNFYKMGGEKRLKTSFVLVEFISLASPTGRAKIKNSSDKNIAHLAVSVAETRKFHQGHADSPTCKWNTVQLYDKRLKPQLLMFLSYWDAYLLILLLKYTSNITES